MIMHDLLSLCRPVSTDDLIRVGIHIDGDYVNGTELINWIQ